MSSITGLEGLEPMTDSETLSIVVRMNLEEFSMYVVARRLAEPTGILFTNAEHMAKQFADTSASEVRPVIERLVDDGWFVRLKPQGRYGRYEVRSYDAWVNDYVLQGEDN